MSARRPQLCQFDGCGGKTLQQKLKFLFGDNLEMQKQGFEEEDVKGEPERDKEKEAIKALWARILKKKNQCFKKEKQSWSK